MQGEENLTIVDDNLDDKQLNSVEGRHGYLRSVEIS